MKCNWCGEGNGQSYTKNKKGVIYYYYCYKCVGDFTKELSFKINKSTYMPKIFYVIPECVSYRKNGTCKKSDFGKERTGCNEMWCEVKVRNEELKEIN